MMARTPRRRNVGQSSTRGRQRSARDEVENTEDDVYQSMLADATTSSPTRVGDEGQTVKKRRVGGRLVVQEEASVREQDIIEKPIAQERRSLSVGDGEGACQAQTVFKDFSDSEESDMDWEDVNLQGTTKKDDAPTQLGDLNLVLDTEDQSPGNMRRKPLTTSEKKLRLDIHKMHLLCLLSHVHLRNYWCNSTVVHVSLPSQSPIVLANNNEEKAQTAHAKASSGIPG